MAEVTVTGPYNGDPVDATAMRAILQVLADGINDISSAQLGTGCVTSDAIGASQVTMSKLFSPWVYYDRLDSTFYRIDGNGGRMDEATWYRVGSNTQPLTISLTAPDNCYVVVLGEIVGHVDAAYPSGAESNMLGIQLNKVTGNTDTGSALSKATAEGFERWALTSSQVKGACMCYGLDDLDSGETAKYGMNFSWEGTSSAKADVTVYAYRTHLTAILLPR